MLDGGSRVPRLKSVQGVLVEIDKLVPERIRKCRGPRRAETVLKTLNNFGGHCGRRASRDGTPAGGPACVGCLVEPWTVRRSEEGAVVCVVLGQLDTPRGAAVNPVHDMSQTQWGSTCRRHHESPRRSSRCELGVPEASRLDTEGRVEGDARQWRLWLTKGQEGRAG